MPVVYRSFDDSILSAIGDGAKIESIFEELASKNSTYVHSGMGLLHCAVHFSSSISNRFLDECEYTVCGTLRWKRKARRILFLSPHIYVRVDDGEVTFRLDEDYHLDVIVKVEESPDTLGSIRTLESAVITTLVAMKNDQAHTSPATKRDPAETESEDEEEDDDKDGENIDDMFLQVTKPLKKRRTE